MRHIYGDSVNIEHVKGEFKEDGWLSLVGMMGTDDGPQEWTATIRPPVGNEPICVDAVLTSDYETTLFNLYMKPLGSKWDYSYVDDEITKKDFDVYVNNMGVINTGLLEDELPDPKLLHLYK